MRWIVAEVQVKNLNKLNYSSLHKAQEYEFSIMDYEESVLQLVEELGGRLYNSDLNDDMEVEEESNALTPMDCLLHLGGHKMVRMYTRKGILVNKKNAREKLCSAKSLNLMLDGYQVKVCRENINKS